MGLLDDLYSTELGAIRSVPDTTRANVNRLKGLLGVDSTGNGLLSDLQYGARNALSQAKWNAGNRLDNIQRFVTDPEYRNSPEVGKAMSEAFDQYADAMAPGNMGSAMAGVIKAYHGSPHRFDAFDMSKIGTGEGAQAYGHGLYFAENPKTAIDYQKKLVDWSAPYDYEWNGKTFGDVVKGDPEGHAVRSVFHHGKRDAAAIAKIGLNAAKNGEAYALDYGGIPYYEKMLDTIKQINKKDINATQGSLYDVDLRWPDVARETYDPLGEHHLLDWNKEFSKQSPLVRQTLNDIGLMKEYRQNLSDFSTPQASRNKLARGQNIQAYLEHKLGSEQAVSDYLREQGIPGIKYLDAGSRNSGRGTHNYVIFDDAIPRIVTRNGKSLLED